MAKTKALISCAFSVQLICAFVFAYKEKAGFLKTQYTLIFTNKICFSYWLWILLTKHRSGSIVTVPEH